MMKWRKNESLIGGTGALLKLFPSHRACPLLGASDDRGHNISIAIESVIHHSHGRDLVLVEGKSLRIEMSKPRFVDAA